ncbi:MAG: hypothetical protein SCH68_05130 [Brevefilum sp.]|nr:hypothetical protein [Brevefilum sp.]
MEHYKKILWPVTTGIAGMLFQAVIYFGLVSWAETPQHALDLLWQERWLVFPLFTGFGLQVALFTILKKRLFIRTSGSNHSSSAAMTGAGGATSTMAMVACCAHHVTDVLPILGFSVAATFLAKHQSTFMLAALMITYLGIIVMVSIIFRERRKDLHQSILGHQAP